MKMSHSMMARSPNITGKTQLETLCSYCGHNMPVTLESLNERIWEYDRRIESMTKERYPEAARLKQKGVGDLIATTYVLTIEDPAIPEESRRGMFCGVAAWTEELGRQ
jgi:hypothetical protein